MKVTREWRAVNAEGEVTGIWQEHPNRGEAWVRNCIERWHPDTAKVETRTTTVSDWA